MPAGRSTLVQTVGTSLLTNLGDARILRDYDGWVATQPPADGAVLGECSEQVVAAARAVAEQRFERAGEALVEVGGRLRVLGAEVGSLEALRAEGAYATLREVILLHSDTDAGAAAARALQVLLGTRFQLAVERRRVAAMRDERPSQFKVAGLRNLVQELAKVTRARGARNVVIDATGGFKAQIATAVAFGQAFGIPVLYLFERFPEIIEFPPLPVTVDLALADAHHDLLEAGEVREDALLARFGAPLGEGNTAFAQFAVCLAGPEEQEDSRVWAVSPMGQLMLEVWRAHHPTRS